MIKRNKIGLSQSEIPARAGEAANSGGWVWVESVSAGMRTVEAVIRELSQNDVPVLVVAEHGSGKAAAAARIHALSSRSAGPFQVCQGRGTSEEILAVCRGRGGTVYVQDVGDLPAAAQRELARQIGLNGEGNSNAQRRMPRYICGTSSELAGNSGSG